jgi:hypothetical protein
VVEDVESGRSSGEWEQWAPTAMLERFEEADQERD